MENEITPCHICGAPAVHLLASGLLLCANVACYHASMELIKEALRLDKEANEATLVP